MQHRERILIIGAGPAGYTAAIYSARAGLKPLMVAGLQPGGQLTITTDVENYPGFADGIQGPELMEQMRLQAERVGTRIQHDIVTSIDLSKRPFVAIGDSGDEYIADAVIIATGAQARWLGIPGEAELSGFGVSACATCDGFFYRGKDVLVVGGGNTAVEEALYLAGLVNKVTVVHRRDMFKAERILQDRLFANPKIEVLWNHEPVEVLGAMTGVRSATGLRVRSRIDGLERDLHADGIFVAIGHDPASAIFKGQLEMDAHGYIVVAPHSTATSVPGVYSCGDVSDPIYRQAVTAAGMGCMAALEAERLLATESVAYLEAAE